MERVAADKPVRAKATNAADAVVVAENSLRAIIAGPETLLRVPVDRLLLLGRAVRAVKIRAVDHLVIPIAAAVEVRADRVAAAVATWVTPVAAAIIRSLKRLSLGLRTRVVT